MWGSGIIDWGLAGVKRHEERGREGGREDGSKGLMKGADMMVPETSRNIWAIIQIQIQWFVRRFDKSGDSVVNARVKVR